MRKTLIFGMILVFVLAAAGLVQAATDDQKRIAIDKGLAYLATTQQPNGSWAYGSYPVAGTAAALLAFADQYYKPTGWNLQDYSTVVTNATNYLLNNAQKLNFNSANWWGFNGTNNSGYGIQWNYNGEETYQTGMVISALARVVYNPYGNGKPALKSPSSPTGVVINGSNLTYSNLLQSSVDSFVWGQTGTGSDRYGGWRYFPNQGDSDMSTTQWPVADFMFVQGVPGVAVNNGPTNELKTALQAWITACQYTSGSNQGGVDYQPNFGLITVTHAGGFLLSNKYAGGGGDLDAALTWLNANWKTLGPSGTPWGDFGGNFGNPYAMWAVYKGLAETVGLTDPQHKINNLLDPNQANWWEDYCEWLVNHQNGNGSWNGGAYWTDPLSTAWDINILNATATAPPTPLPGTLLLLGSGLLGIGVLRKRIKK
jgi:hypothetical protein